MKIVPTSLGDAWDSGIFIGDTKAVTRCTIQKAVLQTIGVTDQVYATVLFSNANQFARELPNVKSVHWERSIDGDVATCTIELWNTRELPAGTDPDLDGNFDQLGYYTYNRGATSEMRTRWGVGRNDWAETLIPDRVIRTYQGYGADYGVDPESDPNLVLTGVWVIDDVVYTADGLITVECRDLGRLLQDQIMFPPVVPIPKYPLSFSRYENVADPPVPSTGWLSPLYDTSTTGTTSVFGHHGVDAFDGDTATTYWQSIGHSTPSSASSYEWIQGKFTGQTVNAVKVSVRGGPYKCFLSVYTDTAKGGVITGWNGRVKIPYVPSSTNNGSAITYSQAKVLTANATTTFTFPAVAGMTKVRLTFTDLHNSHLGTAPYVAAVRDIQISAGTLVPSGTTHVEGDYEDYTEIVKRLLAYGGFFWPAGAQQKLTGTESTDPLVPSTGHTVTMAPSTADPYLVVGRVWGDIEMSQTNGEKKLDASVWDKKPILDGVNYVKDILGFNFWVDEHGAAIFRTPNLYQLGNWECDEDGLNTTRTSSYVTITSLDALIELRAKLSSRATREKVFIANASGSVGAVAQSILPTYGTSTVNFRRIGGWTDQNFTTEAECKVMAELIMLRQLFTFRQDSIRIPGYPRIQVDDQIKLYEQVAGEAYFHHVRSISSTWEAKSGEWFYDLTTAWLGSDPAGEWAFDPSKISAETQAYLSTLGHL